MPPTEMPAVLFGQLGGLADLGVVGSLTATVIYMLWTRLLRWGPDVDLLLKAKDREVAAKSRELEQKDRELRTAFRQRDRAIDALNNEYRRRERE